MLTDPAETGAVTLALPEDVQTEAFEVPDAFLERARVDNRAAAAPEPGAIARAAELIETAKRPLIVAGGGAIYSGATAGAAHVRRRDRDPGVRDAGGKGRDALRRSRWRSAPWARPARPRRTRWRARRTS